MIAIVVSCEHATCAVPEAYREIFRGAEEEVVSPVGWEPGSLNLAQGFAMKFRTPLVHGEVTRLLIDLEQEGDAQWSRFSLQLPEATRVRVAERHARAYRQLLSQRIQEDLRRHAAVLHLRVHTDDSDGKITLETPPAAALAEALAAAWQHKLIGAGLDVSFRRNGLTSPLATALAGEFAPDRYAQIRLAVAQTFFLEGRPWRWETLKKLLLETLSQVVSSGAGLSGQESPATDPR